MFKRAFLFVAGALLALAFVAVLSPAAFAADAAAASTSIDFQSVATLVLAALAAAVAAIARVGVKALTGYLETKTGIELDASTRAYLNTALDSAVGWATLKASERLGRQPISIDVKSAVVADAANYLLDRVPDALAHFSLTNADVEQLIEARLTGMFNVDAPEPETAS